MKFIKVYICLFFFLNRFAIEIWTRIWELIEHEIYSENPPYYKIGFRDGDENSSYYSSNITKEDAKMINAFMTSKKISQLNTRLIKVDDVYEIKIASTKHKIDNELSYLGEYTYEGNKIRITKSDFSFAMDEVVKNLKLAKHYASNNTQKRMIDHYISNFITGEMDDHKNAMKEWITDLNPAIETNIGYIETYLDPLGVRAEYEGFVAIVNKEVSKLFSTLVENAEELIAELPWSKDFEKEKFHKPDFTSLDVVAFAWSGTPIGINLPNYDDIREKFGYKNVDLGNVYPKPTYENLQFMKEETKQIYYKYSHESLMLIVALHELLGHGTGKLLTKDVDTGKYNFDFENLKNPFTNEPITTAFLSNETWSSKFGKLHSGYEECRADAVALYLGWFKKPFDIFFEGRESEYEDILYTMFLEIIRESVTGLMYYDEATKEWGQAHTVAGYVIAQVLYEKGDIYNIELTEKDGKEYLYINFEREGFKDRWFEAMKPFLQKLHILKCMGDYDAAKEFFEGYAKVDDFFLHVKKIVEDNKLPRRLESQPNLLLNKFGKVEYKDYDQSLQGIVQSYVERFPNIFYSDVYDEWINNVDIFRIKQ